MLCSECGAQVSDGFSHCPWCGQRQEALLRPVPELSETKTKATRRPLTHEEDAFVGPLFRFPPLTVLILLINALVYGVMEWNGGSDNPFTLLIFGAKLPAPIFQGEYWRLFTANFIHIGLLHLVLNGLTLIQLGMLCENLYGKVRFFNLYILSGVGGFLASTFFLDSLSAGASASLFGLMGATLIFGWRHYREIPLLFRPHFTWYLLPWVVIMLAFGFFYGGIDNLAHVGGLITGGVSALFLRNQVLPDPRARHQGLALLVCLPLALFSGGSVWAAYFELAPNLELARATAGPQDPAGQIEVLSRFIDSDSSSGLYFYLRAQANYAAGRLEAAEADYREALAREYDETTVRNELSWTLTALPDPSPKQLDEAVGLARKVVRDDRNAAHLNTLGWALFLSGDLQEAQTQLRAAIQDGGESPDRAIDYYILALIHHKKGDEGAADASFGKAEGYARQVPFLYPDLERFRKKAAETLGKTSEPLEKADREKADGKKSAGGDEAEGE